MNTLSNLCDDFLNKLSTYQINDIIFQCRDAIARKSTIKDVLDNQNYNTLRLAAIMEHVDPSLEVCLNKRNGVDYYFNSGQKVESGEMKAVKINTIKNMGRWSFHALAVIANGEEDNFLLYAHNGGQPVRIYDVRDVAKVEAINEVILAKATDFKDAVFDGRKSGKFDIVQLNEDFVRDLFQSDTIYEFEDGKLRETDRQDIMKDQRLGVVSIYSDALKAIDGRTLLC